MLNVIWLGLIIGAVIIGLIQGTLSEVVSAVTDGAKFAITIAIGIAGVMAFWTGLMRIAEQAGMVNVLSKILAPVMRVLFPGVPSNHPAMGAMIMNMAANMLGLGNAATPFGLRAMRELQTINPQKETATDAMCMFLALNTSSIQLIPATAIAFLAAGGSKQPTAIVFSGLLATICSTSAAIICAKCFSKQRWFRSAVTKG